MLHEESALGEPIHLPDDGTSNKGGDKMGIMITVLDGDIDGVYKSPQHASWERR